MSCKINKDKIGYLFINQQGLHWISFLWLAEQPHVPLDLELFQLGPGLKSFPLKKPEITNHQLLQKAHSPVTRACRG